MRLRHLCDVSRTVKNRRWISPISSPSRYLSRSEEENVNAGKSLESWHFICPAMQSDPLASGAVEGSKRQWLDVIAATWEYKAGVRYTKNLPCWALLTMSIW